MRNEPEHNPNQCAVCGAPVVTTGPLPIYFCKAHFEQWKPAILASEPWVRYLRNAENNRRRRRRRRQAAGYREMPLIGA
jgi:hypothetical protein